MTLNNRQAMLNALASQSRLDAFDDIFIEHPRLLALMTEMGELMVQSQSRIAKNEKRREAAGGRPVPIDGLYATPLLGPSGSGKSASLAAFVSAVLTDPELPNDEIPVLHVTLRSSSRSPRQVQAQILEQYGAPEAQTILSARDYSEAWVNEGIRKIARYRKTSVVILDEVHNTLAGGAHIAPIMAKAFKSLLNDGIFSLILSGTDEAMPLFTCDNEIQSRQRELIDFGPFTLSTNDIEYFLNFVAFLESEMLAKGVVAAPIGLTANVDACATVYEMSEGVIGVVSRIVRLALNRALRSQKQTVDWHDIAQAFRAWQFAEKHEGRGRGPDPFVNGPADKTKKSVSQLMASHKRAA